MSKHHIKNIHITVGCETCEYTGFRMTLEDFADGNTACPRCGNYLQVDAYCKVVHTEIRVKEMGHLLKTAIDEGFLPDDGGVCTVETDAHSRIFLRTAEMFETFL